jgi:signal transduction histidine kinase
LVLLAKNRLDAIKSSARMLQTRIGDKRVAEFFSQTIDSDVDKTDTFIRGLMNYVKASSPVKKTNTVQTLLERVFKKHQPALEQKKIRVFKRLEADLPETTVSDEHLWYILDSLLDYIVEGIPPFETVGIATRATGLGRKAPGEEPMEPHGHSPLRPTSTSSGATSRPNAGAFIHGHSPWPPAAGVNESHIEISLVSTGNSITQDQSWQRLGIPGLPVDEPTDLPLLLIKEMVVRNRGRIKFETSEDRSRTMITLTLPVERRKVFYYVTRQE